MVTYLFKRLLKTFKMNKNIKSLTLVCDFFSSASSSELKRHSPVSIDAILSLIDILNLLYSTLPLGFRDANRAENCHQYAKHMHLSTGSYLFFCDWLFSRMMLSNVSLKISFAVFAISRSCSFSFSSCSTRAWKIPASLVISGFWENDGAPSGERRSLNFDRSFSISSSTPCSSSLQIVPKTESINSRAD